MRRSKLLNGVNMKIAAATSVVIFTLLVSFMGVYAWFETTRTLETTNEEMKVYQYGRFSKISFYRVKTRSIQPDDSQTSFSFYKSETGYISYDWESSTFNPNGDTDITLDQYEPLDQHQPCLAIVELNQDYDTDEGEVAIKLSTNTEGFLGKIENKKNKYSLGPESKLLIKQKEIEGKTVDYYPLSSVASFSFLAFSDEEYYNWSNNKTTFDVTVGQLHQTNTNKFVTVNNEQQTSTFSDEITIYNSGSGQTVKYIAVVIDYYFDAIESIYSTFLGDSVLEDSYKYILNFICDWEWNIL